MKAIVFHQYGSPDVLALENVDMPVPGEGEVLLRVRAASINPMDWAYLRGWPYAFRMKLGWRSPRRTCLGADVEMLGAERAIDYDRCFPLADAPDAMRYHESGHVRGKVVISIGERFPVAGSARVRCYSIKVSAR